MIGLKGVPNGMPKDLPPNQYTALFPFSYSFWVYSYWKPNYHPNRYPNQDHCCLHSVGLPTLRQAAVLRLQWLFLLRVHPEETLLRIFPEDCAH